MLLPLLLAACSGGGGDSLGVSAASLAKVNVNFAVPSSVALGPDAPGSMLADADDGIRAVRNGHMLDILIPEAFAAVTPTGIASAAVVISGTGVTATNDVFNVTPGVVVSRTYNLPVGTTPSLTIQAYSGALGTGTMVYQGTSVINLTTTVAGAAVPVSVAMTPLINVPPVPVAPAIAATSATAATSQIVPTDPNKADTHTYAITTAPLSGTATVSTTGLVSYTSNQNFAGTDTLTVTVTDQGGLTGTVTIPVTVAAPAVAVTPTLSINSVVVAEGSGGGASSMLFGATLSAASAQNVTLNYTTSDGTALAASDYTATTGTLTIPAGQTTGSIPVSLVADSLYEPNETLNLTVSNAVNAILKVNGTVAVSGVLTGTLLNDDLGGMNDTGVLTWSDGSTTNALNAPQAGLPGQDAEHGRDALASGQLAGGLFKFGASTTNTQGFDFSKLDATGTALANQAVAYGTTPWDCVHDNATGLYWEVKTTPNAGGLRDGSYVYSWFNSTGINTGGNAGTANGGTCVDIVNCDTEKYIAAVNTAGLCGFNDWRLPTIGELSTLMDYGHANQVGVSGAFLDGGYFPNLVDAASISSTVDSANAAQAWGFDFGGGTAMAVAKSGAGGVRLVRGTR